MVAIKTPKKLTVENKVDVAASFPSLLCFCAVFNLIRSIATIIFVLCMELMMMIPRENCSRPPLLVLLKVPFVMICCILLMVASFRVCLGTGRTAFLLVTPYLLKLVYDIFTTICFVYYYCCIYHESQEDTRIAFLLHYSIYRSDTEGTCIEDSHLTEETIQRFLFLYVFSKIAQASSLLECWMVYSYFEGVKTARESDTVTMDESSCLEKTSSAPSQCTLPSTVQDSQRMSSDLSYAHCTAGEP